MKYFYHSERTWDTLESDCHPDILARSGWVQCTKSQYQEIRENNERQNRKNAIRSAQKKVATKTTVTVASNGKTRAGGKAKVKSHNRKLTAKQRRWMLADELQRTAQTHTDLVIEHRKNSDGSISYFDRISGWEVRRVTANGLVLEQNNIKDLRRF